MIVYVGPIRRVKSGNGHRYVDANNRPVPGVTTMLKGIPKEALMNWGPRKTAEYAIDHWDELSEMPLSERLNTLAKARYETSNPAAKRGTEIHRIAVEILRDREVDVPDDLAGYVESLIHFFDSYQAVPVLTEAVVFSHTHGYAGTLDAVIDFPYGLPEPHPWVPTVLAPPALRLLVDYKPKVYGETALQTTGYRFADTYLDEDGHEQPMIPVDGCAGVAITPSHFDLLPLESGPDQLRTLLYAREVKEFADHDRDMVGDPVRVPSRVQRRRLEIVS